MFTNITLVGAVQTSDVRELRGLGWKNFSSLPTATKCGHPAVLNTGWHKGEGASWNAETDELYAGESAAEEH